jgi:SAM-dependent methyltransferase
MLSDWDFISDQIRSRYSERLMENKNRENVLGWHVGTAEFRYLAAANFVFEMGIQSIVDIGCGFGGLLKTLRENNWKGKYIGLDLSREFIRSNLENFSQDSAADFFVSDNFFDFEGYAAEHMVAIGLFNHASFRKLELREEFLERIFNVSSHSFSIDFLCTNSDLKNKDLVYQDFDVLCRWCDDRNLAWKIDHSYLKYEFMMHCRKTSGVNKPRTY